MKNEKTQILITSVMIGADFLMILLMSILSLDFSWDRLKDPLFWISVMVNQFATILAYFSTINLGMNYASKEVKAVELFNDVNKKFKDIDTAYLSADFSNFIHIENLKLLCWAFIEKINKKLQKKISDNEREKSIKEKKDCLEWYNYYCALNIAIEEKKPENDFDIFSKEIKNCRLIEERYFVCEEEESTNNAYSIEKTKTITNDSIKKIGLSIIVAILFQSINPGIINSGWNAVYQLVWRMFLIAFNVYCGFEEGKKIISVNKVNAFKERQKILNQFFNKMFILGKIKSE